MPKPSHIVVVSSDPAVASRVHQIGQDRTVSVVENLEAVQKEAKARTIDGLVLGDHNVFEQLGSLAMTPNLSKTVVLAGPLPVLDTASKLGWLLRNGRSGERAHGFEDMTLEDYVESKFSEFVRAMKVSSACSLHSTLLRAVERPLIELALRETNGNQIQAAQLLGMNRNTLRKKISELEIPIKRRSRSNRRDESS